MTSSNVLNRSEEKQLRKICQLYGLRYYIWVVNQNGRWVVDSHHGLHSREVHKLNELLSYKSMTNWLDGALQTGRVRSRRINLREADYTETMTYLIPHTGMRCGLLIGGSELSKEHIDIIRLVVEGFEKKKIVQVRGEELVDLSLVDVEDIFTLDLQANLTRMVKILARYLHSEFGVIGIRSGDIIRLEGQWGLKDELKGEQYLIEEYELIQQVINEQLIINGLVRESTVQDVQNFIATLEIPVHELTWIVAPIELGVRTIGIILLARQGTSSYSEAEIKAMEILARHIAPAVEKIVAFNEVSLHLEKMAILNEFASAISAIGNVSEVAGRIKNRIRRIFNASAVNLFLAVPGRGTLLELGVGENERYLPVQESGFARVISRKKPIRFGSEAVDKIYHTSANPTEVIVLPLLFRGNVIGLLCVETEDIQRFSSRDEQLLVVIAAQIAGVIENIRLHEETRRRAVNLELIHQVVTGVIGLTDVRQICQTVAELLADRFNYHVSAVILATESGNELCVEGIGGVGQQYLKSGYTYPVTKGITGEVFRTGESRLVNDASAEKSYLAMGPWRAGSVMCVPLKERKTILGVLDVEQELPQAFVENDLLALEALAGVLSSVIMNARRYQQLQLNLQQMQALRETALDISADLDLDTVLERVVNRARVLMNAKGAELGFVDYSRKCVTIKISKTPWEDYFSADEIPFNHGVSGRVVVSGKPIVVQDYNTWEGRLYPEKKAPFVTVVGVPLIYKGEVIGSLTVSDDEPREFSREDVRLLELFASQIAISIHNATLYQNLQESILSERSTKDKLVRSARLAAVGEMAAGVAHELNNPLTTIAGFAELILDELPEDSPQRADLELVLRESRRAREVVRRLLDFSRPRESMRVKSDINQVIQDVLMLIKHLANTSGIRVVTNLGEHLPKVQIDQNQIKQVLLNLINNGIQAMPYGGILTINTQNIERDNQQWLVIEVEDTGEGISEENLGRIFEPFFTTRMPGDGTGLGLSVSYGIVRDHGGLIEAQSELGVGSVFRIFLPVE